MGIDNASPFSKINVTRRIILEIFWTDEVTNEPVEAQPDKKDQSTSTAPLQRPRLSGATTHPHITFRQHAVS